MMNDFDELTRMSYECGDGFYLVSEEKIDSIYNNFFSAFKRHYNNVQIAYSFKTNNAIPLLRRLKKLGAWAEVTSEYEYALAKEVGFEDRQIVYNGPYKKMDIAVRIAQNEGIVNLDSLHEVKKLCELTEKKNISVGIRCNADVDGRSSRFGIDIESSEMIEAIQMLEEHGIKIKCFMCHIKTKTLDDWMRKVSIITEFVNKAISEFELADIDFVDFGGGYVFDEELFENYAQIITDQVKHLNKNITIILEPGAAICEGTIDYYAKVVNVNSIKGKIYYTIAATMNDISAIRKRIPGEVVFFSNKPKICVGKEKNACVVGFTCLEDDIIVENIDRELQIGDFVIFTNVGAYSLSLRPEFIRGCPAILLKKNEGEIVVVRYPQRVDCMNKEI